MTYPDALNEVLRYAADEGYHRKFDTMSETDTLPAELYADHLEANGKPTHAALIRHTIHNFGSGLLRTVVGNEHSGESDMLPGEFRATVSRMGDRNDVHNINLKQRSRTDPNNLFVWTASLHPKIASQMLRGLIEEGTTPEVVETNDKRKQHMEEGYGLREPEQADKDDADWWKNGDKD